MKSNIHNTSLQNKWPMKEKVDLVEEAATVSYLSQAWMPCMGLLGLFGSDLDGADPRSPIGQDGALFETKG